MTSLLFTIAVGVAMVGVAYLLLGVLAVFRGGSADSDSSRASSAAFVEIAVGGGGYHDTRPYYLCVPSNRVFDSERIRAEFARPQMHAKEEALLTWEEYSRACKAMCPVPGCKCGSFVPAVPVRPDVCARLGVKTECVMFMVAVEIE
jgi:hypothetical protein